MLATPQAPCVHVGPYRPVGPTCHPTHPHILVQAEAWLYWGWIDLNEVVAELQKLGPYWDRHQGADHIFTVTADPGRCQYPQELTRKSIYLTHMGMLPKVGTEPCNLFDTWGGACDPVMNAARGAINGNLPYGCHLPHQDIVVPPSM